MDDFPHFSSLVSQDIYQRSKFNQGCSGLRAPQLRIRPGPCPISGVPAKIIVITIYIKALTPYVPHGIKDKKKKEKNVKAHVYTDKPASIDASEDNIELHIPEIPAEMLERVCQNCTKPLDHLKRSRGQYLHEIIFKHYIIWTVLSLQINISCIFSQFCVCF